MKHIRDLIAKQVLFSSSKTLDVDMLDDHLYRKVMFYMTSSHTTGVSPVGSTVGKCTTCGYFGFSHASTLF